MSHPAGNINPRVSSRSVNGYLRGQKRRIRKGADCDRNHVRQIRKLPVQGRAATRAEVIGDDLTAVADARVRAGRACDLHLSSRISRLNAKGAACPPLASQTVTNRNANGITLNIEGKLSAATACLAGSHTLYSETNRQFQWTLACLESLHRSASRLSFHVFAQPPNECTECSITNPRVFRTLHLALWNIHRSAEDHLHS
jgi:hypothetical protein